MSGAVPPVAAPAKGLAPATGRWVALSISGLFAVGVIAASMVGPEYLQYIFMIATLLFGLGWGTLVQSPSVWSTSAVVAVSGVGAVFLVTLPLEALDAVEVLAAALGLAVFVAFVHEMMRGANRTAVVESVAYTLTGQVVAMVAAGWVALELANAVIAMTAMSFLFAMIVRTVTTDVIPRQFVAPLAIAAGVGGALLSSALPIMGFTVPLGVLQIAAVGAAVGACANAMGSLLESGSAAYRGIGLLALALGPLLVAGMVAGSALRFMGSA